MKRRGLGCLTTGGLIAVVIAVVAVGISYAATGGRMFSPGKLNAQSSGREIGGVVSHADLEKECAACHPAFWQNEVMTDRCLDCHQDIISQLSEPTSLHRAVLAGFERLDCRDCHTDHGGSEASMTNYLADDFKHELVGFSLTGHRQIQWERELVCKDCHTEGFADFSPQICLSCHQDVALIFVSGHTELFGMDCLACHDGVDTYGKDFDHSAHQFSLIGRHAEIECAACHPSARTLTDLQKTATACESCHLEDDAHKRQLGLNCDVCHEPTSWNDALFDHGSTGFLLEGGHKDLECENCHETSTYQGEDPQCVSCHLEDEPHAGQFGSDCAACHVITSWQEIIFSHQGAYAQDCAACHSVDKPVNHYPGRCSACHLTSAWRPATFDHQVAEAVDCLSCHTADKPANHYGGQCSACHLTSAWSPATFDHQTAGAVDCLSCHSVDKPANHFGGQCSICHSTNAWKPASFSHTFPLNHGGANQQCALCHTNNTYPAYTCYGCHEHNPANIQREHEGVPNLNDCVRCHWDGREHDDNGGGED